MRHEAQRRLTELWGEPVWASKYISAWSPGGGLDVALETRPPDRVATLWVPWPGPFGRCPPYGEVYAAGRGRNSNTYRCRSLAPGRSALRLRLVTTEALEEALGVLAAAAVEGHGREEGAGPEPEPPPAANGQAGGERTCYLRRVEADHLGFPEFTEAFEGDPERRTLMNFSANYHKQAGRLPDGTRLLVWVRQTGRVFADMELAGGLEEGAACCRAHGFAPDGSRHGHRWGRLYRPVRILRRAAGTAGTRIEEAARAAGVNFRRLQSSMVPCPQGDYDRLVAAAAWDYFAPGLEAGSPRPVLVQVPALGASLPIPGAEELLARIEQSRGLPERNMEDLVKELLVRLGHSASDVLFQIGRIDVMVRDAGGRPAMVLEVKRSLLVAKDRDQARRQGFDYAAQTGARMVVLSDADQYEIYDRLAGLDLGSMFRGSFRLTAFRPEHAAVLDLLRPGGADGGDRRAEGAT